LNRNAPRGVESEALAREWFVILALALLRSQAGPSAAYADVVHKEHWSNDKLTRLVRAWLDEEVANSKLVPPDPCADLKAWRISGYHRLPTGTTDFLQRIEAVDSRLRNEKRRLHVPPATRTGRVVLELLQPYEPSAYRPISGQLKHVEAKLFGADLAIVAGGTSRLTRAFGAG
jgi:hypothetical protein